MKKALILIDIQNEYFPGGRCELVHVNEAAVRSRDLLSYFRENKLPVFHIQHIEADQNAEYFAQNSTGIEINELVSPLPGEPVIQKHFPNSFRETELKQKLESLGITHVVLTGNMSHMCVDSTTRAALDFGYECTVIEDSCTTYDMEFKGNVISAKQVHGAFMQALAEAGAEVLALESFLANR